MDVKPSDLRLVLAKNVRACRRATPMTQVQLAEAAGVTQAFISDIEKGKSSVTVDTLAALSEALGVAPRILLDQESFATVP